MQNPILNLLQGSQNQNSNIMMQAVGAMMRGESPQTFLQNLAKTNPQLQGLDFTDINKTAEDLYASKGQDINAAKSKINSFISSFK